MEWVRIDATAPENPKIVAVGCLGWALYSASICFVGRNMTNGFIPANVVHRMVDLSDLEGNGPGKVNPTPKIAAKLVAVGLWKKVPGGYQIPDYLEYNPSKEIVESNRQKRTESSLRANKIRWDKEKNQALAAPIVDPITYPNRRQIGGTIGDPISDPISDPNRRQIGGIAGSPNRLPRNGTLRNVDVASAKAKATKKDVLKKESLKKEIPTTEENSTKKATPLSEIDTNFWPKYLPGDGKPRVISAKSQAMMDKMDRIFTAPISELVEEERKNGREY